MTAPQQGSSQPGGNRVARGAARLVVTLRWWIIGFWLCATLGAWFALPSLGETQGGGGLGGLLPRDTPAIAAELRDVELFGFPLMGRTTLVQRDASGLSPYAQARTVVSAVGATRKPDPRLPTLRGALPVTNALGVFPSSREQGTTALTYLLFEPDVSLGTQRRTALRYADLYFAPSDHFIGVTGSVPARAEQGDIIRDSLPTVEALTLAAIVLIVGFAFRSVVAPVVAVVTTGVAYVLTLRLSGGVAELFGVATPSELEPVIVALLLGVVTDYTVFFLAALRRRLELGEERLEAAQRATVDYGHIVLVAGIAVAAGTAALMVAESLFFRALGPALVFTVLSGLVVAVTLVPALLAVLGRWSFWPVRPRPVEESVPRTGRNLRRAVLSAIAHRRGVAGAVLAGTVALLVLAAVPLTGLGLGVSFVGSLPADSGVRQAADAARAGFSPGILSPTTLLLEGQGLDGHRRELTVLGNLIEGEPGVAGVLGPGDAPRRLVPEVLVLEDGTAARFLVVLDDPALGATAIDSVVRLRERLPELVESSGLQDVTTALAGDTAAAAFIVEQTRGDLVRIAVAALTANFLMLLLFLRAPVAAAYLLAGSVLSLAAALGLTMLVFGQLTPGAGLTFYVPFAAAVLLVAFGSDYNIFAVGTIWERARVRPLTEAIVETMPRVVSALLVAGCALAASFGLLSVVPLVPFRQLAFVMLVGIMIDVLLVRSLMLPAALTVFGRWSAWPRKGLTSTDAEPAARSADESPGAIRT
ncbi:MAG TPA: MMPL family transporter [Marmoricola sp.]|nr:MMPL family transporter [Marmoricola sp.]